MSKKTRSTLSVDAVAQAAAHGGSGAFMPARKLNAIAGLAGFVLRLFRYKEQLPVGPGSFRESSGNLPGRKGRAGGSPRRFGPTKRSGGRAGRQEGGLRHG
jgi:hypothetical protein